MRLQLESIGASLSRNIPRRFIDLIEIAALVYIADQVFHRGAHDAESMGAYWRRWMRSEVPVRDPSFWRKPEVTEALVELLSFLSEDRYEFVFSRYKAPPALDTYLEFGDPAGRPKPSAVALFSGGLDSLGGVVERVVQAGEPTILVSHESTTKLRGRVGALRGLIDQAAPVAPEHITVRVNKKGLTNREYTQRSRSFLYAALAAAVAQMADLDAIWFYENGVVSLNLPLSPQVIGARATRTTHPRTLAMMQRLFSLVADRDFGVRNGFLWKTKAEVVRGIVEAGHGAMVGLSTSCTHTWLISKEHPHCGVCSQCVDRRFAVLAGGGEPHERAEAYGRDLLTGQRDPGESRILLASYLETAQQVAKMNEAEFFGRYGEAARALRWVGVPADQAARQVFELYQRHALDVLSVVKAGLAKHSGSIMARTLPESCLLRLVQDPRPSVDGGIPAASGAPGTPAAAAETPVFQLRWLGQGWDLCFEGHETRLVHQIGLIYLAEMIRFPGKRFSAAELLVVARPEAAGLPAPSSDEAQLDPVYLQAISERLRELNEELDAARRRDDLAELGRLEAEKDRLIVVLRQSGLRAFGGRGQRKESRAHKRFRDRVSAAVKRAIENIGRYDAKAAAHFRGAISRGATLIYDPRPAPPWQF